MDVSIGTVHPIVSCLCLTRCGFLKWALRAAKKGSFDEGSKVTFEPKDLDLEQILFYVWLLAPLEHRFVFVFFLKQGGWLGQSDSSVVNATYCSYKGLEFGSQHPCWTVH